MGKRGGGRRRKRAGQWAEQQHQQTPQNNSSPPKNKKVKHDEAVRDSDIIGENSKSERACPEVEVCLVGVDEGVVAPDPLMLEETADVLSVDDSSQDADEKALLPSRLFRAWKYLASSNGRGNVQWRPSKIQQHLWGIILASDWNVIGVASTGSGKTLAYALPTVLSTTSSEILVLVPTRELVQQVAKVFQKVVKAARKGASSDSAPSSREPIPVVSIHGGTSRDRQMNELESAAAAGRAIVVATPGRLLDLLNDTKILPVFSKIVLDEADQLAKDGDLGPQVDEILSIIKDESSRLVLVSATFPEKCKAKFQSWVGSQHALVQVDRIRPAVASAGESSSPAHQDGEEDQPEEQNGVGSFARIPSHLDQVLHVCAEHKKARKLIHTLQQIYKRYPNRRSRPLGIVFVSKIVKLKHISKLLDKEGLPSVELHSQLGSAKIRQNNLAQFACGQKPLLLATDLAARGIDIPSVEFVIQYDFPGNLQQYVHRCGRAGRTMPAQTEGSKPKPTIYSFFTRNLKPMVHDLIQLLEANDAWVDPNLRSLAAEGDDGPGAGRNPKHSLKRDLNPNTGDTDTNAMEEDEEEIDDFPELSGNRIVLKRASHVSDASSGSDSDDE